MRTLDAMCGDEIRSTIGQAIAEANKHDEPVGFDFNGVNVVVEKNSSADLIYRDWHRGLKGYLGKDATIGPHPKTELSAEEQASDAEIEAANEKRRQERQAEHDKKQATATATLQGALGNAGPIELKDADTWAECKANNRDVYGGRCVRYAEEWARLMQVRIANGETVAECADELSHLADDDGITGFMYGAAVSMLAKCWKHGEELRRWHNKETQIGTEGDEANESGGVLNPAVLNVR